MKGCKYMLKVQEIRELIKLIDQSSINEFTYETNGTTVSMKKTEDSASVSNQLEVTSPVEPVKEKVQVSNVNETKQVENNAVKENDEVVTTEETSKNYDFEITSPMVGTFYRKPNPESNPYVEVGQNVTQDTIVCIVEAMKLFNEIEAETTGEITEILVEDGELVEYGQPLFRVKTK